MKNLTFTGFVLLSFFLITKTYSQGQGNVTVHLGPSFPVSDFASDDLDNEDAGGAAVGLNLVRTEKLNRALSLCLG